MVARDSTPAFQGVDVKNADIQDLMSNGVPAFTIVGHKNIFLVFLVLITGLRIFTSPAYALSCDKHRISIVEEFLAADVVFKGQVLRDQNNERGAAVVVEKYYKSNPNPPKVVKLYDIYATEHKLENDLELLVYGSYVNDNPNEIVMSQFCGGRTKETAEAYLQKIKSWKQDPQSALEFTESLPEVVLTGQITFMQFTFVDEAVKGYRTLVKIKPTGVVHNATEERAFFEKEALELEVNNCGEDLRLGDEYVIQARLGFRKKKNGESLEPPEPVLHGYCSPQSFMNLNEEGILESLSRKVRD